VNRYIAALLAAAAVAVGYYASPDAPPLDDTRRTESLVVCVGDSDALTFWAAWGDWYCDGRTEPDCLTNNAIEQGVPMCVDGVPVGWVLRMPATPHDAATAQSSMASLAVFAEPDTIGWSSCPDEVVESP
jgi:hypothetical protein